MDTEVATNQITQEIIESKIFIIRGKKVMLDRDLAGLYRVLPKRLNEQVKRNGKRFPSDFMFQLTKDEKNELVANCDRFKTLKYSTSLPHAFTEQGIAMLSTVLNSDRGIDVNIAIMRIFVRLRKMVLANKELALKLLQFEKQVESHDEEIKEIFHILRELIKKPEKPKRKIGFINKCM